MHISKSIKLFTAAIGGAWIGLKVYNSQDTYNAGKNYMRGLMVFTIIGGLSGLVLTHKYCPCGSKL